MKKKITILGSTGSIGKSLLKIIETNKNKFEIVLLTANQNYKTLFNQAKKFKVKNLIINSDVNINELTFNHKIEKLKNYINGYENKVKLNENKLKIKYENKKIILNGSSELYIAENEKNTIDFKILKNKDNILFETIVNLSKVDLKIDEISYIKKSKQKAVLKVKGLNKENYLILKSIIYSENKDRI